MIVHIAPLYLDGTMKLYVKKIERARASVMEENVTDIK